MNRSTTLSFVLLAVITSTAAASAQTCRWGSFDASRISYAAGTLHGSAHNTLRGVIQTNGGTIASPTATLTPQYLAGVDVFFTSILDPTTGGLSTSEQAALQAWVKGGGTLIVTADYLVIPQFDTFTSVFGVGYASEKDQGFATTVAAHLVTAGVATIDYAANASLTYGPDARLLARDANGRDFMVVLEPATGFSFGGRLLVWGDHNTLTDGLIKSHDNEVLARNVAQWACGSSATCPSVAAGWVNYGAGWPGKVGVPQFYPTTDPRVGGSVVLFIANSSGGPTSAYLLIGLSPVSQPTAHGGTILVSFVPQLSVPIALPGNGLPLVATIPNNAALCGVSFYLQAIEIDAGASHLWSFTPGLRLDLGS